MKDSKLFKILLCKLLEDFEKLEEEKTLEGPLMSSKEPGLADMKSFFSFQAGVSAPSRGAPCLVVLHVSG